MAWASALLSNLVNQLHDPSQSLITDLSLCGTDAVTGLQSAAKEVLDSSTRTKACLALEAFIASSHKEMAAHQASNFHWRRLYTDASILRSLVDLLSRDSEGELLARRSIARLDRALVIAGAPGEGRQDLILALIRQIQAQYLPPRHFDISSARSDIPMSAMKTAIVGSCSHNIPRLREPPLLALFQRELVRGPFILSGYALGWPAMNEHPWSSFDYLRSAAGRGRVVPIEIGGDYRTDDWSQQLMDWDDFLDSLASNSDRVLYLAQHNLFTQIPSLQSDIIIPDYVYSCPSAPPDFPSYKPPSNEEQLVINVWLGPKGTNSPAHTDPYFNFYAQIAGRKTVWLAPPSTTASMYPYPASTSVSDSRADSPAVNTLESSMSNTSRVDVFDSNADRENFPLFWERVVPEAMSAVLEPGDVLFFPPGWWHAMRSESTSFSVSMWF